MEDFIMELPVEEIMVSLDDIFRPTSLEEDLEAIFCDFDYLF